MAATAIHGKTGTASFTGLQFLMTSWSVSASADTAEATDMGDTWKTYLVGFKDWTATCECNLPDDGGGIAALGTSATLTLDTGDGTGLACAGTAICTGFAPTADANGVAKITLTFQGSGALTES